MSVSRKWNAARTECTLDYEHMRRQAIIFLIYSTFPTRVTRLMPITLTLRKAFAGAGIYLVFTVVGLYRDNHAHKSRLRSVLLTHSVVYLIITCVTLIPMTVRVLLLVAVFGINLVYAVGYVVDQP